MNMSELSVELPRSYRSNERYEIVSKMGFLLGIPESVFMDPYNTMDANVYRELSNVKNAVIVRSLCILRTKIESNLKMIIRELKSGACFSLQSVPGLFDPALLIQLSNYGVVAFRDSNKALWEHVAYLNKLISDRVSNCRGLFPEWLNWDYLRSMFMMPNGFTEEGVAQAGKVFVHNWDRYPFQVYTGLTPYEGEGNVLLNDFKFLTWLYKRHDDTFRDSSRVRDITTGTRNSISEYFADSRKLVFVVDCENSDSFSFLAVLKSLTTAQLSKVHKIILVTDDNASPAWNDVARYTTIPVETRKVTRLVQTKSLVDPVLVAAVCKEFYANDVDSFVLCSSDSDFYGMIYMLDTARFLLMVERDQTSTAFYDILSRQGIFYCHLEDFNTCSADEFREDAIARGVAAELTECLKDTLPDILDSVLRSLYLEVSDTERNVLLDKSLPKRLGVHIEDDGRVVITA